MVIENDTEKDQKLYEAIHAFYEAEMERKRLIAEKFPNDVPNEASNHAIIRGYCVENSYGPSVGEYNHLCQIGHEDLYIWTYAKDVYSVLVSEVNLSVKEEPFWKTASYLIWISRFFNRSFEEATVDNLPDYKWMYYFDPTSSKIEDIVFLGLSDLEREFISTGILIKATDIADLAPILELLIRDDKVYTALSLLFTAFCAHPCCLICEMGENPWHDHLAEEPKIWNQAGLLPSLENAVVQSCRAVEAIIGEPPNQKNAGKVYAHKQHWKATVGIDPDTYFEKASMSYLEFYYSLFHDLRNPSAHSYGNIHYDLARKRAVEAQCFADVIVNKYIELHTKDKETALNLLNFNRALLDKVSENMSTCMTKE